MATAAPYTAIQDRLELSLNQVKTFLKIDHSAEDGTVQMMLTAAKTAADKYCRNYFTDNGNGEPYGGATDDPLPIPDDVRLWVLARIGRYYERRSEGMSIEQAIGVGQSTWGEESFRSISHYKRGFFI